MGGDAGYDVFVSYSRSDEAGAAELNGWLRAEGLSTFYDCQCSLKRDPGCALKRDPSEGGWRGCQTTLATGRNWTLRAKNWPPVVVVRLREGLSTESIGGTRARCAAPSTAAERRAWEVPVDPRGQARLIGSCPVRSRWR